MSGGGEETGGENPGRSTTTVVVQTFVVVDDGKFLDVSTVVYGQNDGTVDDVLIWVRTTVGVSNADPFRERVE